MNKKNIIFFYPGKLEGESTGSKLRPLKMLQYLREKYEVDLIAGGRSERIKNMISVFTEYLRGKKYDFLYFENTSSPHILSSFSVFGRRIPLPTLSAWLFLVVLRVLGVKSFYYFRDVHWFFPEIYPERYSRIFLALLKAAGIIELYLFSPVVDFCVPNQRFSEFIFLKFKIKAFPLPPGGEGKPRNQLYASRPHRELQLFYVGGCGALYDPQVFLEGFNQSLSPAHFKYCTREDEYLSYFPKKKLNDRITVLFKSGEEMRNEMCQADIGVYLSPPIEYIRMSYSVKVAEYFSAGLPVICFGGTYVADLVKEYNLGWVVEYSSQSVSEIIDRIYSDKDDLLSKRENAISFSQTNHWRDTISKLGERVNSWRD